MPKRKNNNLLIKITSGLLVFVTGFGIGYLYNEDIIGSSAPSSAKFENVDVCFSPEGRCELLAIKAIRSAKKEILVQSYSFTSKGISKALIEAHKRGIKVALLFDKSQIKAPYSQVHVLNTAGIETKIDRVKGIAHNKVIIIDGKRLITGSYNFSNAANKRNSENMLYIKDEKLAKAYKTKWFERFSNSF